MTLWHWVIGATVALALAGTWLAWRVALDIEVRRTLEIDRWDAVYGEWFCEQIHAEVLRVEAERAISGPRPRRWWAR